MRKALFFIDEGAVKIVLGATVKVLRPEDAILPHNEEFLRRLFAEFSVFFVQELAAATKAEFDEFIAMARQRGLPDPHQAQASDDVPQAPAKAQAAPMPPPKPRPRPPLPKASPLEAPRPQHAADLTWVKLKEGAPTVVIDDLLTREAIRDVPNSRKALVIPAGLAVNLALLDPDEVRKSAILRRLIQNKAVVFTTADDATRLQVEHDERVKEEEGSKASALIDRDSGLPIAGSKIGGEQAEEAPGDAKAQAHDAEPVEISAAEGEEPNEADFVSSEDKALRGIFDSLPAAPAAPPEAEGEERAAALPPPPPRVDLGDPSRPKGSIRRK